jgi:malonate-semialdehyde dehydrogenase (acetylating)/methylmalonate-semialdehyde dehydrogenase
MDTIAHWISNELTTGTSGEFGDVFDPATGSLAARVPLAGPDDVDAALDSARRAADEWSETSLTARTRVLFAFRGLVESHRHELAEIISAQHGKVPADALGEVTRGLEVVDFACGLAHLMKGERAGNVSRGVDAYSIRQPVGVAAGITPFNFPVMVPMWMFPLAIACGNAFVLKPSERDPGASALLGRLFAEAGLPPGVFNVLHGDARTVNALLTDRRVDAVSFVGSTPVARHVYETATAAGKRVQSLGGAKNHMVVLPDADIGQAADAAVSAGYGSAGERCMAISVVLAVGDVGDRLVPEIEKRTRALTVGPATSPDAEMGPLVTRVHRERVAAFVDAGVAQGATLVVDGRDLEVEGHENGFFLGPCLFDDVTPDMKIYREEIFGPVLSVLRVDTYDDAVELINACPFGNGTAIFTKHGGAARAFEHDVHVGMVGINVPIPVPMAYFSFGGWKDSLFGDLHMHGADAVRFYTRGKAVTSRWPDPHEAGVDLGFPAAR